MFTDEPSLIAVNIGQIPEAVRKRVKVVDPIDPDVKLLPRVPWCYDMAEQYRKKFGEDLLSQRRSLFVGNTEKDRWIRSQFWSLVADLTADRYFGTLGTWCHEHGVELVNLADENPTLRSDHDLCLWGARWGAGRRGRGEFHTVSTSLVGVVCLY